MFPKISLAGNAIADAILGNALLGVQNLMVFLVTLATAIFEKMVASFFDRSSFGMFLLSEQSLNEAGFYEMLNLRDGRDLNPRPLP